MVSSGGDAVTNVGKLRVKEEIDDNEKISSHITTKNLLSTFIGKKIALSAKLIEPTHSKPNLLKYASSASGASSGSHSSGSSSSSGHDSTAHGESE